MATDIIEVVSGVAPVIEVVTGVPGPAGPVGPQGPVGPPGPQGGFSTYQSRIVADGASEYWPLDDASGTGVRNMASARIGTISGGVTLNQPGVGGSKAMTFDGLDDQIVTAASVSIPLTSTIEAWIFTTETGQRPIVCLSGEAPLIGILSSRQNVYDANNGFGGSSTTLLVAGVWHHVVYVLTPSGLTFYLDGVALNTITGSRTVPGLAIAGIGRDLDFPGGNPNGFWKGSLQDIAIYPRALTPAEIAAHYALRVPPA